MIHRIYIVMKIYKISGKTWRDKIRKQTIILYHVSSEKVTRLLPRSRFMRTGRTGVYLSASYKSLIGDWAPYVRNKREKNHPYDKMIKDLLNEKYKLEDMGKTEEISKKIEEIEDKLDKFRARRDDDRHFDAMKGYQTLYIHTIQCPKEVYEECERRMANAYENDPDRENHIGFWSWGQQVFIDSEFLSQLKIIDVKEMNMSEFKDEYSDTLLKRHLDTPNKNVLKQLNREWESKPVSQETQDTMKKTYWR